MRDHAKFIDPFELDLLDLGAATRITYGVEQRFAYEYSSSVWELQHQLMVIPPSEYGSYRRIWHDVAVSHSGAETTQVQDSSGNEITTISIPQVDDAITFEVHAHVERTNPALPVLVRENAGHSSSGSVSGASAWLSETPLTGADDDILAHAQALAQGAAGLDFADKVAAFIHDTVQYELETTDVRTTAAQALSLGRGVCQDQAHIMLAMCRSQGLPARYVSGHLLGEGGTHAWVEVLVPPEDPELDGTLEAVAIDPCHGRRCGPQYVTIAVGRDYREVAPTSGWYRGTANSTLSTTKRVGIIDIQF